MIDITCLGKDRAYCLIHLIKVCFGLVCSLLCSLQFYRGYQFHRFCDLSGTFDAGFSSFNINYRCHDRSPYFLNDSFASLIALISFSSVTSSMTFVSAMLVKISGYFVSIKSNNSFWKSRI